MITRLSTNIANFIRQNHSQAASMDVLIFSLTVMLNATFVTAIILAVAAVTGRFLDAVILLASYLALRFFSGGMHLPTSRLCNVISVGLFIVLIHLPVAYWNTGLLLNSLAFIFVILFAPTKDIMHLNRMGPKYTIHFKIISMIIVASNFWLQSPVLALAFFAQAVSVTPVAYKAVSYLERG
jgi:accessory gene regulator B